MFKTIKKIAALTPLLGAAYFALSPRFNERLYASKLFQPLYDPDGDYVQALFTNNKYQDVFFATENGSKLHAIWFQTEGAKKTVLVSHGNEGNLFDLGILLQGLIDGGNSVFVYDYQGFGRSQGKPSIRSLCEDSVAAYDWLVTEGDVAPRDVIAYGESIGGGVTCQLIRTREVCGVILQSAFTSMRDLALENMPWMQIYPTSMFPQPYMDNALAIEDFSKPVLIIHGAKDTEVGKRHGEILFERVTGSKSYLELPNTAHDEVAVEDRQAFVEGIREFGKTLATHEPVAAR
ncbi:unnamed protein product [Sphagnum balticum]